MLLISDLDAIAPQEAEKIRKIARDMAAAWDWPFYMALDHVLMDVDKRIREKMRMCLASSGSRDSSLP